jgi:hypothetical protein
MKRFKYLSLLIVGALALGAAFGSGTASASKFTAGKIGANLTGNGLEATAFAFTEGQVKCNASLSGETEALESESLKAHPLFQGCTVFGLTGTVLNFGCTYKFTAGGELHIEGCEGGGITFAANTVLGKCKVLVNNQSIPAAATYSNTLATVDVQISTEALHLEVTESTGICPLKVGTHSNAKMTAKFELKAEGTTILWDI